MNLKIMVVCLVLYSSIGINISAQPKYVAHRGASYLAPENTRASIKLAWKLDADAAECDVMLTADNKIILMHDKNVKRLTGRDLIVSENKYSKLRRDNILLKPSNLEKYSKEKIPLLKDALRTIPKNKTLVIEIKCGEEIIPQLKKVVNKYWKRGNIIFIAFNFDLILKVKEELSNHPCYFLSYNKNQIEELFEIIKKSDLDGINLAHKIVDAEIVKRMASIDKKVGCWTVNNPDIGQKMIDAQVEFITTDRPYWLKEEILKNKKK